MNKSLINKLEEQILLNDIRASFFSFWAIPLYIDLLCQQNKHNNCGNYRQIFEWSCNKVLILHS